MQKGDDLLLKNVASFQIFLIVFSVFSFAFLTGQILTVSAGGPGSAAGSHGPGGGAEPPAPAGAGKDIGYMDRILGDDPLGGWDYWKGGTISHLTSGLIWGGIAYGVVSMIGGFLGLDDNQQEALSTATGN